MKTKLMIFTILLLASVFLFAQTESEPLMDGEENSLFDYRGVEKISVTDTDNDDGTSLDIEWVFSEDAPVFNGVFRLYRIDESGQPKKLSEFDSSVNSQSDRGLERGKAYTYYVVSVDENGAESSEITQSSPTTPKINAIKKDKIILFLFIIIYTIIIMILVEMVKRGKDYDYK